MEYSRIKEYTRQVTPTAKRNSVGVAAAYGGLLRSPNQALPMGREFFPAVFKDV